MKLQTIWLERFSENLSNLNVHNLRKLLIHKCVIGTNFCDTTKMGFIFYILLMDTEQTLKWKSKANAKSDAFWSICANNGHLQYTVMASFLVCSLQTWAVHSWIKVKSYCPVTSNVESWHMDLMSSLLETFCCTFKWLHWSDTGHKPAVPVQLYKWVEWTSTFYYGGGDKLCFPTNWPLNESTPEKSALCSIHSGHVMCFQETR